jgi:hypothetical protein
MATLATLAGDPTRGNMLAAMLDGRAPTAAELAQLAGIAAPSAWGHLAKLLHAKLVGVIARGGTDLIGSHWQRSDACSKAL